MSKTTIVTLSNLGLKFLGEMLGSTGWAKTPEDIYRAGQIISDILPVNHGANAPKPPFAPVKADKENGADAAKAAHEKFEQEFKAWAEADAPTLEFNEKQVASIRTVLNHFSTNGSLPPSKHVSKLLLQFGLVTEDSAS